MKQKHSKKRPEMLWEWLDVSDMHTFETDVFDLVIDKACIDSLFCRFDYLIKVALMLKEVQRVLKPGCHYFCVSVGPP